MLRRSRFTWGSSSSWTTALPARPWNPVDRTVGGRRVAMSGIPASYVVRRDQILELPLRLWEWEWPDLLELVTFGQTSAPFRWYPEAELSTQLAVVYLETPAPLERWGATRSQEFPQVLEVTLRLRASEPELWRPYFELSEVVTVNGEPVTVNGDPVTVTI